ncbi:hypothetical protein BJ508DRAFT_409976 [Ascobolus immersus RN42]|uniref:Phosphoserine phosphatase n=1 Tax=Ascobolus immersus RN42 TaxID=1160509 RepID=A0A3N4IUX2_ASCIM|nr:hypothetical protein BJ508DRAFT_409976 [Ascobolus immersus RN42]
MSSDTPALATNPKFIFFTDFDGTITMRDSNDYMTDNIGYGPERRRELNIEVLEGRWSFRNAFKDMLDSIHHPFEECIKLLCDNITLDAGFADFFTYAQANNIPVVVLSSGMTDIIRALLQKLIGPAADDIQIIANTHRINEDGSWDIIFHDESDFGHDKSRAIRPYHALPDNVRPTLFYAGDGVSDLSAAKETDLLFAKYGHDLITYCQREKVPFTVFHTFKDIHAIVKDIVDGKTTAQEVAKKGAEEEARRNEEKVETTK